MTTYRTPHHAVLEQLEPFQDLLGEHLDEVRNEHATLEKDLTNLQEKDRCLRIAVVGQVKAGKSSFLNAVLFEGKEILPKAATPMTAALTVIRHSSEPRAQIEFYTEADWRNIERTARRFDEAIEEERTREREATASRPSFGRRSLPTEPNPTEILKTMPLEVQAAVELVEFSRKSGLDIRKFLGKTIDLEGDGTTEGLIKGLQDYVGAGGRYTAITKSSILYIDDPRMAGLEVVDTPGVNDPVVSRGARTREYLGQCDIVYALSRMGEFLDQSDMELLSLHLPEKGISKVVLVGTMLDSALRQKQSAARDVETLLQLVESEVRQAGKRTLQGKLEHCQNPREREILTKLAQAPVQFVSSLAYVIGRQLERNSLEKQERYHYEELNRACKRNLSAEELRDLSLIDELRQSLFAEKVEKARILADRLEQRIQGSQDALSIRLSRMREALDRRREVLASSSFESLVAQEKKTVAAINKGKARIEGTFEECLTEIEKKFAILRNGFKKKSKEYEKVHVESRTETRSYQVEKDGWWNKKLRDFSWGGYETRTRTITTPYADVQNAISQIKDYALEGQTELQNAILDLINIPDFHDRIVKATRGMFDLGDADFDGATLIEQVKRTLNRLTIPDVEFGNLNQHQSIVEKFTSSEVSGESEVKKLQNLIATAIDGVVQSLVEAVNKKIAETTKKFHEARDTFVTELVKDIERELHEIRMQISDKQKTLDRINLAELELEKLSA